MADQRFKRRLSLRKGLQSDQVGSISDPVDTAGTDKSFLMIDAILALAADAGTSVAADTADLFGIRGVVTGATLTRTKNFIAGVSAKYNITGAKSTTYPAAAVLAQIGNGVTAADGAVVAAIAGDTSITNCTAMFKVMNQNSIGASGPDFGVDLQDAAHDGYKAVDSLFYKKAVVRLTDDIVLLTGTVVPTDGVAGTGAGNAGPGSLYLNTSDAKLRVNTNTKASPTWTVVGAQTA